MGKRNSSLGNYSFLTHIVLVKLSNKRQGTWLRADVEREGLCSSENIRGKDNICLGLAGGYLARESVREGSQRRQAEQKGGEKSFKHSVWLYPKSYNPLDF